MTVSERQHSGAGHTRLWRIDQAGHFGSLVSSPGFPSPQSAASEVGVLAFFCRVVSLFFFCIVVLRMLLRGLCAADKKGEPGYTGCSASSLKHSEHPRNTGKTFYPRRCLHGMRTSVRLFSTVPLSSGCFRLTPWRSAFLIDHSNFRFFDVAVHPSALILCQIFAGHRISCQDSAIRRFCAFE